jgi:hypothetical protein
MLNIIVGAGAVGARAASRYGPGSDLKMRLLAAPAPQHWFFVNKSAPPRYMINMLNRFQRWLTLRRDIRSESRQTRFPDTAKIRFLSNISAKSKRYAKQPQAVIQCFNGC